MPPTNKPNKGTAVPPTGTAVPPTGTAVPPTGTAVPPTGTAVPPTGTAVPPTGGAAPSGQQRAGKAPTTPPAFNDITLVGQGQTLGVKYTFKQMLSKNSGEAFVFLVSNNNTSFVLKLYKPHHHPNHDVLETLTRVRSDYSPLINVYAHGVWTDPTTHWPYDFEVMQHCTGGSLADVSFKGKEKELAKVAVEMAAAIDFCHKHNILHRDIKPANFLYTDKSRQRIALADFGIAMTTDSNGSLKADDNRRAIDEARTVIYAAPEMYYRTMHGFSPNVSYKSDFYSLGLTLMALWMGEGTFTADESKLVAMKNSNTLVYPSPKEMSTHMLSLLMALTRCDPNERAAMPEIVHWVKGEDIFDVPDDGEAKLSRFRVPFNVKDGLVATTPQELAQMMGSHPDLAKRYLYQDQIGKWLKEFEMFPEASAIEDITERLYAKDKDGGLYAARLVLDPQTPYIGLDGNVVTIDGVGKELFKHEEEYGSLLENENHPLWMFIYANIDKNSIETTPDYIQSSACGVPCLAYELDPSLPFELGEEGHYKYFKSVDDIINGMRNWTIDDNEIRFFTYADFDSWLKQKDPARHMLIKERCKKLPFTDEDGDVVGDDSTHYFICGMVTLFTLAYDCGYDFRTIADNKSKVVSLADIANAIMDEVAGNTNYSKFTSQLDDVETFHRSRLYAYLLAREKYTGKISYIDYCINFGGENAKRYGPYNKRIAAMKVATSFMGRVPELRFEYKQKVYKDKDSVAQDTDMSMLTDQQTTVLADWLTLFFAENPYENYKKRSYYDLTTDYFEFLRLYLPQCSYVKRIANEESIIEKSRRNCNLAWGRLHVIRGLIIGVCIVPLVLLNVVLVVLSISAGTEFFTNMMTSVGSTLGWIFAIIVALYIMADTSFFGGIIVGAIVYFAINWICTKIGFLVPWLGVGTLILLTWKAVSTINFARRPRFSDPNFGFGEQEAKQRHLIAKAFGCYGKLLPNAPHNYPCNVYEESRDYANQLVRPLWKKAAKLIGLSVITVGLCLYVGTGIASNKYGNTSAKTVTEMRNLLPGTWEGTMGKTKATFTLKPSPVSEQHITGKVILYYRKPIKQTVVADGNRYDIKSKEITLVVVEKNKENPRKRYVLTLNNGSDNAATMTGTYTNETNGNRQEIKLTKTEENSSQK